MSAHRVQLSLQILDDNLYSDFIEELRANRTLNTKIIDVLSAYYYNADLRKAIDDYTNGDEIKEEYDTSTDTSELFADIRNALAVSNFYAEEAMQTLEEGTETIDDILHQTTQHAQEDGFYEDVNESEYGFETPKLLADVNEKNVQKVAKKVKETTSSDSSEHEAFLEKIVLKLCDMVGLDPNSVDSNVMTMNSNTTNSTEQVTQPIQQSTPTEQPVQTVEQKPVQQVQSVQNTTVNNNNNNNAATNATEEEDGFAALMESLNSLDI